MTKANTPDMDAEALGGTIELDQRSAFDFPKSTIEGHIGSGYFQFSLAGSTQTGIPVRSETHPGPTNSSTGDSRWIWRSATPSRSGIGVYFKAKNLTNAPWRIYEGRPDRPIQREFDQATYEAGMKFAF